MFRELCTKKLVVLSAMSSTWTSPCPQQGIGHPSQPSQAPQAHDAPPSLPASRRAQPSHSKLTRALSLKLMSELEIKANPCSRWPPTVFPQQCLGLSPAQPLLIHPLRQQQPHGILAAPYGCSCGALYGRSALPSTGTHVPEKIWPSGGSVVNLPSNQQHQLNCLLGLWAQS